MIRRCGPSTCSYCLLIPLFCTEGRYNHTLYSIILNQECAEGGLSVAGFGGGIRYGDVGIGVVHAFLATFLLVVAVALVLFFFPLLDKWLPYMAVIVLVLSAFWGGFIAAKRVKEHGLVHGLLVGLLYLIIVLLIGALLFPADLTVMSIVKKTLSCLFGGMLGGIYGVGR